VGRALSSDDDAVRGGPALDVLFERPGLPRFELPAPLVAHYGGPLGFDRPRVLANFVATVDGVVALPVRRESGEIISGGSEADRFVMGLLRACADAVMIGAGTFRKASGHLWHPGAIYPAGAALFAETRTRLGLRVRPTLVLVTGSGLVDTTQPALGDAIIVTTPVGEAALRSHVPATARIVVVDSPRVRLTEAMARLQGEGLRVVLTEGGPTLFAELVAEKLVDELFLTSSPALFGRFGDDRRKSLADGLDLGGVPLELWSARRDGSHLFLRYAMSR
jgi:riboflavin biosynthesis pyrimidine reductase